MKKLLLISLLLIACTKEEPFVVYDTGVVKYVSKMTVEENRVYPLNSDDNYINEYTYEFTYDDEYNIIRVDFSFYTSRGSHSSMNSEYIYTYVYEDNIIYCYCNDVLQGIYYLDSGYLNKFEYYYNDTIYLTYTLTYDSNGYVQTLGVSGTRYTYTWKNGNIQNNGYSIFIDYTNYKDNLNITVFDYGFSFIPFSGEYFSLKFSGITSTTFPKRDSYGQYIYTFDEDGYPTTFRHENINEAYELLTYYNLEFLEIE